MEGVLAFWWQHGPVLSVVLPSLTAVVLLLIGDQGGRGLDPRSFLEAWQQQIQAKEEEQGTGQNPGPDQTGFRQRKSLVQPVGFNLRAGHCCAPLF